MRHYYSLKYVELNVPHELRQDEEYLLLHVPWILVRPKSGLGTTQHVRQYVLKVSDLEWLHMNSTKANSGLGMELNTYRIAQALGATRVRSREPLLER